MVVCVCVCACVCVCVCVCVCGCVRAFAHLRVPLPACDVGLLPLLGVLITQMLRSFTVPLLLYIT